MKVLRHPCLGSNSFTSLKEFKKYSPSEIWQKKKISHVIDISKTLAHNYTKALLIIHRNLFSQLFGIISVVVVCFPVVSAKVGLYLLYMHNYYVPYRYLISRFWRFSKDR